jgi:Na+-transporting NADH:ubiquinone oxidoreductase subunit NqrB
MIPRWDWNMFQLQWTPSNHHRHDAHNMRRVMLDSCQTEGQRSWTKCDWIELVACIGKSHFFDLISSMQDWIAVHDWAYWNIMTGVENSMWSFFSLSITMDDGFKYVFDQCKLYPRTKNKGAMHTWHACLCCSTALSWGGRNCARVSAAQN